jgi:hypothetical protein
VLAKQARVLAQLDDLRQRTCISCESIARSADTRAVIGSRTSFGGLQDLFAHMAEARALDIFKSCKKNPIPVYVRLLTCIMSAIKDRTLKGKRDVFVALEDISSLGWTDQQVADAIKKLLKKSGPSAFRGASKPAQR